MMAADSTRSRGGMGLHHGERLQRIAGTLEVETTLGEGTTIRAAWPSTAYDDGTAERMGA
jgi:signal transduction histidine kinase